MCVCCDRTRSRSRIVVVHQMMAEALLAAEVVALGVGDMDHGVKQLCPCSGLAPWKTPEVLSVVGVLLGHVFVLLHLPQSCFV